MIITRLFSYLILYFRNTKHFAGRFYGIRAFNSVTPQLFTIQLKAPQMLLTPQSMIFCKKNYSLQFLLPVIYYQGDQFKEVGASDAYN
jgi:hypothetical protein